MQLSRMLRRSARSAAGICSGRLTILHQEPWTHFGRGTDMRMGMTIATLAQVMGCGLSPRWSRSQNPWPAHLTLIPPGR